MWGEAIFILIEPIKKRLPPTFLREFFKIFRTAVFQDIFRRKTNQTYIFTINEPVRAPKLSSQAMCEIIENAKFLFYILPYLNKYVYLRTHAFESIDSAKNEKFLMEGFSGRFFDWTCSKFLSNIEQIFMEEGILSKANFAAALVKSETHYESSSFSEWLQCLIMLFIKNIVLQISSLPNVGRYL